MSGSIVYTITRVLNRLVLSKILPHVPERYGFFQARVDGLRIWSPLSVFIPATPKDLPQFSDKSEVRRSRRFMRPNTSQDGSSGRLRFQTIIRYMSAENLTRTLNGIGTGGSL